MSDTESNELVTENDAENDGVPPQYGFGPFSIREVAILGVWLVGFVVSLFPFIAGPGAQNVWTTGILWILTIGVPTAAVGLIVLRRFSPDGIRRVGSLGIDQFASVAFSVATLVWLQYLWAAVALAIDTGVATGSWVIWVEFFVMLAGVILTVAAPWLPVIGEDFRHRVDAAAHRNARPLRPVAPRPAPEPKPVDEGESPDAGDDDEDEPLEAYADIAVFDQEPEPLYAPVEQSAHAARSGATSSDAIPVIDDGAQNDSDGYRVSARRDTFEPVTGASAVVGSDIGSDTEGDTAVFDDDARASAGTTTTQAFWALVPVERDVVDEAGAALFRIGPTAWALVIEDRGSSFVVRHDDGRVGYLHDVSGVMRG